MVRGNGKTIEAISLWLLLTFILARASNGFGLTWDETSYFLFSDTIRDWFLNHRSFDRSSLAVYWGYSTYHNPHPPFMKVLNALVSPLFVDRLPFPTSYRMANILYVSGCLALSWRLLRASFSFIMTLAALGFVCLQPRLFGHLMIAATDSPVAMSWLALTLIAWRLVRTPVPAHRPVLRFCLFAILAMAGATKITGFMVVAPLAVYFLSQRNFRECGWLALAALFALAFVPLVSPHLWSHPLTAVSDYLFYPLRRSQEAISTFYLGRIYKFYLPWHYFFVMTAVTFPVILLVLLSGLIHIRKIAHDGLLPAVAIPLGFWLIIAHLPATPKHDGIRQLLSLYPFLGLLSWFGLAGWQWRLREMRGGKNDRLLQTGLVPVILMLLAAGVIRCHPFELSFYNPLIGGIRGAEKRGFEMSYYLEAVHPDFIRTIDPYLVDGARVYMVPPWPQLLYRYKKHGLLTGDFTVVESRTGPRPDYLLIMRRRSYVNDALYTKITPTREVSWKGVSLVKFCQTPRRPGSQLED